MNTSSDTDKIRDVQADRVYPLILALMFFRTWWKPKKAKKVFIRALHYAVSSA